MIKRNDIQENIFIMEEYLKIITGEIDELNKIVPIGARLRAVRRGAGYQYFIRHKGEVTSGKYIKRKDIKLAKNLAQLEYDEILADKIREEIKMLYKCKLNCRDVFASSLNRMQDGKKELVKIPYLSDEKYLINWLESEYEKKDFKEGSAEFFTRRGLRVRSKSEVIIADILDEMNVPFLYEKPLRLRKSTLHPDFSLLNIKERKEVYWEHFGIMDDLEYRNNAFLKIREYEANGYCQYDRLICTFETVKFPLDTKGVRNMIKGLKRKLGYE